jgi:hypothetical protein
VAESRRSDANRAAPHQVEISNEVMHRTERDLDLKDSRLEIWGLHAMP